MAPAPPPPPPPPPIGWNVSQVADSPDSSPAPPLPLNGLDVSHTSHTAGETSYDNPTFTGSNGDVPLRTEDAAIEIEDEDKEKAERKRQREVLFLDAHPDKRIDYVLAYEETEDEDKLSKREAFRANLVMQGVIVEEEPSEESTDGKTSFLKLHVTWPVACKIAKLLYLRKRIKMPDENITLMEQELGGCCDGCSSPCLVGEPIIKEEEMYFTAEFDCDNLTMFHVDWGNKESFFTNAERSLIAKEILDRTTYSRKEETMEKFGINRLIKDNVFKAAYPLHEGPITPLADDPDPFEGEDKDRARLYEAWARPGRWCMYQPLDLIRKYFGEKVGIYFAWLGFYTTMLIPASLAGLGVFIYGCLTFTYYPPSDEICDDDKMGVTVMCPECVGICQYYRLHESCLYSRLAYLFDNWLTVGFAGFMSIWATFFLEFWKRYQKSLQYDWDVANFELAQPIRAEYEYRVRRTKTNPVTLVEEPYMAWWQRFPRTCTSFVGVLFMLALVLAAILGVIIYRIIIVFMFYQVHPNETFARLATSVTGSVINFIVIVLLNLIYTRVAKWLTELETPRTWTEYEDSYTFKMYLFQFVNYYGTLFYIAFFKGSFKTYPGDHDNLVFEKFSQDTCDPSGCLVDLFIQLATIMVLKQTLNNVKEIFLPKFLSWYRKRSSLKGETDDNLYMRWQQDLDYGEPPMLGLFDEYLEMVVQFGFVTIFVAAFPLAPLFALINNVVEIRLDAYKFVAVWRRAPALKAMDIGIWFNILESTAFMSVVTNAFIMGWTSDFVAKMMFLFTDGDMRLSGYINSSLSYFDINDFTDESRPNDPGIDMTGERYCRYRGYYGFPGTDEQYEYTKLYWQIFTAKLAFVIAFEHAVFILTYMVGALIPDTPASVRRLQVYERELVKKLRFDATFNPDVGRH